MDYLLKKEETFLINIINENYKECNESFKILFENISNNLSQLKNNTSEILDLKNIEKMTKILFYLKGTKIILFEK